MGSVLNQLTRDLRNLRAVGDSLPSDRCPQAGVVKVPLPSLGRKGLGDGGINSS